MRGPKKCVRAEKCKFGENGCFLGGNRGARQGKWGLCTICAYLVKNGCFLGGHFRNRGVSWGRRHDFTNLRKSALIDSFNWLSPFARSVSLVSFRDFVGGMMISTFHSRVILNEILVKTSKRSYHCLSRLRARGSLPDTLNECTYGVLAVEQFG